MVEVLEMELRSKTGMITIGVGRVKDPSQAEDIIKSGKTDMVAIGRMQLADPLFCKKSMEGKVDDIVRCVGCNQGRYDGFENQKVPHITCLRNSALGKEVEYELKVTDDPKTILIAGDVELKGNVVVIGGGLVVAVGIVPNKAGDFEKLCHDNHIVYFKITY